LGRRLTTAIADNGSLLMMLIGISALTTQVRRK